MKSRTERYMKGIYTVLCMIGVFVITLFFSSVAEAKVEFQSPFLDVDMVLTSFYGWRDLEGRGSDNHNGVDLVAMATPAVIHSTTNGTVVKAHDGCTPTYNVSDNCGLGFGNHVMVDAGKFSADGKSGNLYIVYAHMATGSVKVKEGDKVSMGSDLGEMGSTGQSTGNHLHVGFYVRADVGFGNENTIDPMKYLPMIPQDKGTTVKASKGQTFVSNDGEGAEGGKGEEEGSSTSKGGGTRFQYFIAPNVKTNPLGLEGKETTIMSNTITKLVYVADNWYEISKPFIYMISYIIIALMTTVVILYLVMQKRGGIDYRMERVYEKLTKRDAIYTKENTIELLVTYVLMVVCLGIVMSGYYMILISWIYQAVEYFYDILLGVGGIFV